MFDAYNISPRSYVCYNRVYCLQVNKGSKFLKKLGTCVSEKYYKIIWFYQLS